MKCPECGSSKVKVLNVKSDGLKGAMKGAATGASISKFISGVPVVGQISTTVFSAAGAIIGFIDGAVPDNRRCLNCDNEWFQGS